MPKKIIFTVSLIYSIFVITGCSPQNQKWPDDTYKICGVAGFSVANRPIEYTSVGAGKEAIFIFACIHGDEPAGETLVEQLTEHLRQNPKLLKGKKLILMSKANPDGLAEGTRENKRGVDLNRNFQTSNRVNKPVFGNTALSEPEARAIRDIIWLYKPSRIISIHQPFECIDYDGPAEGIAQAMGRNCELPVNKLGGRPGSLGSYAGIELGISIITMELSEKDGKLSDKKLWEKYSSTMIAAIEYTENAK
ncbi:MAG: DUF2817 domain-containing protein [Phycisphaerae bacterium]|nr:DUF2817 domain-containing protein [Phycisphaerae bacterium]